MCLRSDAFAMLPSCAIQLREESHSRLSVLWEPCRFPPIWVRSCPVAAWAKVTLSQQFVFGLRKMSPVRYPFSCLLFPAFSSSFFPLCLLWNVPMEGKPLGPTPLLRWILSAYWKSSFRAWEWLLDGPLADATMQHIPSLFAFVMASLAALSAYSCGSAGLRLLPDVVQAFICCSSCLACAEQRAQDRALLASGSFCWALLLSLSWVALGAFSSAQQFTCRL